MCAYRKPSPTPTTNSAESADKQQVAESANPDVSTKAVDRRGIALAGVLLFARNVLCR